MLDASRGALRCLRIPSDFFAFDEGVGRILDDFVVGVEAGDDLRGGAVILADVTGIRWACCTSYDGGTLQAFAAEDQRGDGNDEGGAEALTLKWTWARVPGRSWPSRLSTSISTSSVRLAGSMASEVRTSVPWKTVPGCSAKVRSIFAPRLMEARRAAAGWCRRAGSEACMWKSSLPPRMMSWPVSTLRAVTTPSKGA